MKAPSANRDGAPLAQKNYLTAKYQTAMKAAMATNTIRTGVRKLFFAFFGAIGAPVGMGFIGWFSAICFDG